MPLLALGIALTAAVAFPLVGIGERRVVQGVMFSVNKDRSLRPMLPVDLAVVQEGGPAAPANLSCDVLARDHEIVKDGKPGVVTETVLRCGQAAFVVKQILFSK